MAEKPEDLAASLQRSEQSLLRRDQILQAVSFAAGRLLADPRWDDHIDEILARICQASGAGRCHLYRTRIDEKAEHWCRWRSGWAMPGQQIRPETLVREYSFEQAGFGHYIVSFREGRGRQVRYSTASAMQRATLEEIGLKSLLAVPILVAEQLWGIVFLAEESEERIWTAAEIDALQAAGDILGSAVERQAASEALRQSEEKYRSVVEGANLPIVMVDEQGVFRFANSAAVADLGVPADLIVGRRMHEIFPPPMAEAQMTHVRQALKTGRLHVTQAVSEVQGRQRWYEARIQPLRGSDGSFTTALIFASDITERKESESRILSYQTRLRSLASELALTEERERRRIASELHDQIGQALAMAKIKLGSLRETCSPGPLSASLDEIWRLVDQTIHDTRSLTFQLSPPILYELGFEPAVEWLVERFRGQQGIPAAFSDDGAPKPLSPDLRVLLFQAIRELLANVVKHARAKRVTVEIRRNGDSIEIKVSDDGIGFDISRVLVTGADAVGFGFLSIRERLGYSGGDMEFDSAPGKGTRILLRAPLLTGAGQIERPHR